MSVIKVGEPRRRRAAAFVALELEGVLAGLVVMTIIANIPVWVVGGTIYGPVVFWYTLGSIIFAFLAYITFIYGDKGTSDSYYAVEATNHYKELNDDNKAVALPLVRKIYQITGNKRYNESLVVALHSKVYEILQAQVEMERLKTSNASVELQSADEHLEAIRAQTKALKELQ